jgi:hypothetical protein
MKNAAAIVTVLALVAGLAYWQWRHTGASSNDTAASRPMTLQEFAVDAAKGLPRPYADGFSIVRVGLDGQRLLVDLRSADIAVADIDPAKLPRIRDQEQADVIAATCKDPNLLKALHGGATVVRRFADRNGQPIFEVSATARHCGRML